MAMYPLHSTARHSMMTLDRETYRQTLSWQTPSRVTQNVTSEHNLKRGMLNKRQILELLTHGRAQLRNLGGQLGNAYCLITCVRLTVHNLRSST